MTEFLTNYRSTEPQTLTLTINIAMYLEMNSKCVVPKNIHTTATERIGNSLGAWCLKDQNIQRMVGV